MIKKLIWHACARYHDAMTLYYCERYRVKMGWHYKKYLEYMRKYLGIPID